MKTSKISKKFKNPPTMLVVGSVIFMALSVFILLFGPEVVRYRLEDKGWKFKVESGDIGQIGDVFGGTTGPMVAWLAAILTFAAFYIQYKANVQQKKQFKKQAKDTSIERFENRFFEMVRIVRANVEELSYTTKSRVTKGPQVRGCRSFFLEEESRSEGRKVFKVINGDFVKLYKELSGFFSSKDAEAIYEPDYLFKVRQNKILQEREIKFVTYARIDITYCIFFLGLSSEDRIALADLFSNRYKPKFYQEVIAYAAMKPKQESDFWSSWESFNSNSDIEKQRIFSAAINQIMKEKGTIEGDLIAEPQHRILCTQVLNNGKLNRKGEFISFGKYYGGHQFRLGHYFRHLFKMINYVNESTVLKFEQKKDYVGLLRAQLSTAEQKLIFLNSISTFGRIWELEIIGNESKEVEFNEQLVTKYNFIKNIPHNVVIPGNILISDYYPEVVLEITYDAEATSKRLEREKKYF